MIIDTTSTHEQVEDSKNAKRTFIDNEHVPLQEIKKE